MMMMIIAMDSSIVVFVLNRLKQPTIEKLIER